MPAAIGQLQALLTDTVRGVLRRPAIGLLLLLAVLLNGALPTLDLLSFLAKRQLVADAQVALLFLTGILAAGLAAASGLGEEFRRGAPELLYRNLSPAVLVWGRFAGLCAALTLLWLPLAVGALWGSRVALDDYHDDTFAAHFYFALVGLAIVLSAAGSRLRQASFPSALGGWLALLLPAGLAILTSIPRAGVPGAALCDWRLLPALGLALPAVWLGAAAACLMGLWFDGSAALAALAAVFVAGLVLPAMLAERGAGWRGAFLPDWQPFWLAATGADWRALAAAALQAAALVTFAAAGLAKRSGR